uniref:(California timema) hypothetical protein n=1 Tax=Timema californicum TaxID=61474 RepID=A0A7R9JM64_TIMCA|nr:unnamed protein product [Timema californicum]
MFQCSPKKSRQPSFIVRMSYVGPVI